MLFSILVRVMYKPYIMRYASLTKTMYNDGIYPKTKTITPTNHNATSTIYYIIIYIFKIEEHAYYEYMK